MQNNSHSFKGKKIKRKVITNLPIARNTKLSKILKNLSRVQKVHNTSKTLIMPANVNHKVSS